MKTLFLLLPLVVVVLPACKSTKSRSFIWGEGTDARRKSYQEVQVPVVSRETSDRVVEYVKASRGWTVDTYELGFLAKEGEEIAISVTPISERYDPNPSNLGSRTAFFVWVNTQEQRVTREGKLQ